LRGDIAKIHAAGAEFVVIGSGTPQQAGWFAEDVGLTTPVLTDPDLQLYRALQTRRGLAGVLHPRVILRAIQAFRRGFRQRGIQGDATQLGGLFVIGKTGEVVYAHRSRFAGDYPASSEFLAALDPA
jgi:peroxiredoxin